MHFFLESIHDLMFVNIMTDGDNDLKVLMCAT